MKNEVLLKKRFDMLLVEQEKEFIIDGVCETDEVNIEDEQGTLKEIMVKYLDNEKILIKMETLMKGVYTLYINNVNIGSIILN